MILDLLIAPIGITRMWEREEPVSIIVSNGLSSALFTVMTGEEIADHLILGAPLPFIDTSDMFELVATRIPPQLRTELSLTTFIYLLSTEKRILPFSSLTELKILYVFCRKYEY